MAKMGRPTNNPKYKKLQIRINSKLLDDFNNYCNYNQITKTQVITNYIENITKNGGSNEFF